MIACLRAEDLVVRPTSETDSRDSNKNQLTGRIAAVYPVGSQHRVEIDCGHSLVALVSKHAAQVLRLASSSQVLITFETPAAHTIVSRSN